MSGRPEEAVAPARILVVRGGALGDFILTLPVLAALRERFPRCRLELLGYPHIAALAEAAGWVDRVRPIESRALAGFFAAGGSLDPELAHYFEGCALILSFLFDPDGIFEANVRRCSQAQFIAGPYRPDDNSGRHATLVLLSALERLAVFDADPVPRLILRSGGVDPSVSDREPSVVAVHPGSGSEHKNWPEERWSEFLGRLLDQTVMDVLLVGGEAEGARLERFMREHGGPRVSLARSLPLVELARRLEGCRAYVGHDSGITHLAAALGLSGLVLWGPSNETVWHPRSDRMMILRAGDGLANLSVSTVFDGLIELLAGTDEQTDRT